MIRKTLTFNGFDNVYFSEEEFTVPAGWTRLTMEYSTISPGTELFCIREGGERKPGYIMVGRKDDGSRVFVFPSMKESEAAHCNLRALSPDSLLIPLPEEFPAEYAGFLRFINIGMHPFNNVDSLPERVAVIGLGPVGNLAAQTARNFGCRVLGIDPSEARRRLANRCGIAETGTPEEFAALRNEFELVIDTVSAPSTLLASGHALKNGGTCSMVGIVKPGTLDSQEFLNLSWQRGIRFVSGWEMLNPMPLTERNILRGINWISRGSYELKPLLTGILKPDPDTLSAAYNNLAADPDNHICYVIDWRN